MKLLLFLALAAILQPSRSTERAAGGFRQKVLSQRPQVSSMAFSPFIEHINRSDKQILRSYFCGLVEGVVILKPSSVLEAAGFQLDHDLLSDLTLFTEEVCADVARIPGKAAEPNQQQQQQQQNSAEEKQAKSTPDISPRSELIIDFVLKVGSTITAYIGRCQGFFVWSIVSFVLEEVTILQQSTEELTVDRNQSKEEDLPIFLQQRTEELTADHNQSKEEDLPILQQSTEERTADHNQSKEEDLQSDWFKEFRSDIEYAKIFVSGLRSGHLARSIKSKFVHGLSSARKLADSIAGSLVSELHSVMGHLSRSERYMLYWRCLFIFLEGVLRRIVNEIIVESVELCVELLLIEYELEI